MTTTDTKTAADAPKPVSQHGAKIYLTMLQGLRATVGAEPFTFIINGTSVDSDLAEACFISPAAAHALEEDKFVRKFVIDDEVVQPEHFALLQDLFDGQPIKVPKSTRKPIALLCRRLGNPALAHFFVGLFQAASTAASTTPSSTPSTGTAPPPEDQPVTVTLAEFLAKSQDKPPSQGTSVDDLSLLAVDEVNELLEKGTIKADTEDELLKLILDLGPDYTQLLARIHVENLTPDGVARLAENLPYRDLNEPLWQGIVARLKEAAKNSS